MNWIKATFHQLVCSRSSYCTLCWTTNKQLIGAGKLRFLVTGDGLLSCNTQTTAIWKGGYILNLRGKGDDIVILEIGLIIIFNVILSNDLTLTWFSLCMQICI